MASKKLICVVTILFAVLAAVVAQRSRLLRKVSDAFYDCLTRQMCVCGVSDRWTDCWDMQTEHSQKWVIQEVNKCELATKITNQTVNEIILEVCNIPEDARKQCFYDMNEKVKTHSQEIALGLRGVEESLALERTRKCLEPNILYCMTFPLGCMSEG